MTEPSQHRDCAESLGAYALGALPEDEAERVRRHLEECPACRADLGRLRAAAETLPASVEQIEPPPELKSRLMAIVESEAEQLRGSGASAEPTSAKPRRRWALALATALAPIAAVVIVLAVGGSGSGTRTIEAHVAGTLRAAGVTASVQVHGTRARLFVNRLPTPPANHVNELWVKHGAATPKPAGTFLLRSGSVDVARPVQAGDQVLVTVEPGSGSPAPTGAPLIVARV